MLAAAIVLDVLLHLCYTPLRVSRHKSSRDHIEHCLLLLLYNPLIWLEEEFEAGFRKRHQFPLIGLMKPGSKNKLIVWRTEWNIKKYDPRDLPSKMNDVRSWEIAWGCQIPVCNIGISNICFCVQSFFGLVQLTFFPVSSCFKTRLVGGTVNTSVNARSCCCLEDPS